MRVLAGDIGGTNTRFAVVRVGDGFHIEQQGRFASASLTTLTEAIRAFCDNDALTFDRVALAVAGPVSSNRAELTNLDWHVDGAELQAQLNAPTHILNDFLAVAHGVAHVESEALQGDATPNHRADARLFLGAGTGFGVAYALGERFRSSEGGHLGFPPRDDASERVWRLARERFGRVSTERVVSGSGLGLIYDAFSGTGEELAGEQIHARALAGDESAHDALRLFARVYGYAAGDLALAFQPECVFVAGGIASKLRRDHGDFDACFLEGFNDKGRMAKLTRNMGVYVVDADDVGLIGAAAFAVRSASKGNT